MEDDLKENITAKETWFRGLFILLFGFLLAVGRVVLWAVVVVQFLFTLISGRANEKLLKFSAGLCRFLYQCFLYVTFNADEKPFPFEEWPSADEDKDSGKTESKNQGKKKVTKKSAAKKKATTKKAKSESEPETTDQVSAPDTAASAEPDISERGQSEGGEAGAPEKPES